ncbi:hypothetical protein TWF106_007578 [Orbilia oligospora]|uniref:Conjugal transfer protein TraX n=1 Tax=Orbilia oligospora TaxID=2813651 RepID=A0A6G1MJD2_ORBOL|nr:hypothetical protein TWF788_004312 [Orbilia oligospora]KAF3203861.1 hypothetical protein TWF679_010040 [Orbilia oligospora]KAF3218606.1 hypothetical protein TWF106_007578 [Orbilia oligospora]KAF3227534.1 hypothetical protein TWF191_003618 [Orbilia oligospora]KAF3258918.1 hypothetical protein TWF192_011054 [Orbilia oligospora]
MSSYTTTTSTECSSNINIELTQLRLAMDPSVTILRNFNSIQKSRRLSSGHLRPVENSKVIGSLPRVKVLTGPLKIPDGSLELTKWIAMTIMTADHINKYLFAEALPLAFEVGRIVMPLFVLAFAYNLARPSSNLDASAYLRTARRLAFFGIISSVPSIKLGGLVDDWYPLNILFTLLVITTVTGLIEQSRASKVRIPALLSALVVFVLGGGLVEFWWPAVGLGVGAWVYFRSGNLLGLFTAAASCASLSWINGNHWALAAFPTFFILSKFNLEIPRSRWFFYVYYPVHLLILLLARIPMERAGYVFWYT